MDLNKLSKPSGNCPVCQTPADLDAPFCGECGHHFPNPSISNVPTPQNIGIRPSGTKRTLKIVSGTLVLLALSIWIFVRFVVPPVCGHWYAPLYGRIGVNWDSSLEFKIDGSVRLTPYHSGQFYIFDNSHYFGRWTSTSNRGVVCGTLSESENSQSANPIRKYEWWITQDGEMLTMVRLDTPHPYRKPPALFYRAKPW